MEYLVTLSGAPQFSLIVWCWRTGVQLASKETNIFNPQQQLRCSVNLPSVVSHVVKGESRLQLWEINMCAKHCCLNSKEVELPSDVIPVDVCFTNDGALFFVDTHSDVFQASVDLEENKVLRQTSKLNQLDRELTEGDESFLDTPSSKLLDMNLDPCMTICKSGVLVFEPPSKLRYYKRFGDWSEAWNLDVLSPVFRLTYLPESDVIVGWTHKSELVLIDFLQTPKITVLKYYGTGTIDMELIYPDGNTLATVNTLDELQVWDKENGHLMGVYHIRDAAAQNLRPSSIFKSLKANPRYPYVAIAMTDGLLLLVSVLHPTSPSTLSRFLLCDEEISLVCFAPAGDVLVAFTTITGQFFLIQGVPGQSLQVVAHISLNVPVVDCILLPDEQPVLAILFASESCKTIGNRVALYILESDGLHKDSETHLEHSYTKLVVNSNIPNICFGSVHCSRNVHVLEVKRKAGVTLRSIELTGHQLRSVFMSERVEYGLLTYGMDGIVIARPMGSKQQFYIVLPHHRSDLGVAKAFQDPKGEFILSLGRDKSLVCSKLKRTANYTPGPTDPSPEMVEKFREPTTGFFLEGEDSGITWLRHKQNQLIAEEQRHSASEREKIMEDFKELQKKVVKMLDDNERAAPEEQLPISAFDLDKDARESAMEEGRQDRERLRAYTTAKIAVLNRKSDLIKEHCWEPMTVKPTSIESLQYNYKVDNYALRPETEEDKQAFEMVIALRKMEIKANAADSFHPWNPETYSETPMHMMAAPSAMTLMDETARLQQALDDEQASGTEDSMEHDRESQYVMCGSSIYRYMEPSPYHIPQFELNTYLQTAHSIVLLQKDIRNLQEWFNNEFKVSFHRKEKEVSTIKELHEKLRHIFQELLLTCCVEHTDPDPVDPRWTQYEKPEMLLTVQDNEVSVEPYLSPSELVIRQQQAEEEERLRLLLLADNFRELALIKMMDGVLEVKWEDVLKKDIPKPKCMMQKNPEEYNEDDLREIQAYESEVQTRLNERQHYRKILESDYRRVKHTLKDSLRKFEEKLLDFFNLKLRVEASCTQQTLQILRCRLLIPKRNVLVQKEDAARDAIMANQRALADEQLLVVQLQEATADCRSAYEALIAKDKSLDSKFKKEFPELSPMMAENAFRLYKRRPKIQPKSLVSSTLLNELGRCAVACKKPPYLPPECLEVLKGIDFLDSAANAPQNMQPDTWTNICRLRRQRIESEFKIKALALQIAEAENTVSIFQKSTKALKEKDKELQANLRAIQEEQLLFEHDVEVQITLPQGLVEIPQTGSLQDYESAILINRKEVAHINKIIKEAGHKKLKAMRAACNFRRGIVFQEWEHQKVRMHIEDKEDELKAIESVKVIKELQEWLHKRQRGTLPGRGVLTLDKEISRIKIGFEKYIKLLNEIVERYEKKVESKRNANRMVDKAITEVNVEVNELQFERDLEQEKIKKESHHKRMETIITRSKLVKTVQEVHKDIMSLESELDSLRMRTYPILENATKRFRR
ncbi:Cilia- and flagella-associated protein 43 [Frankliniella fusca]|uniref:Cilia- and flagella-associated protein 43 n=1 Tax=Frankliniella fusca TaxID=407009 RepID=A0AAE1GYU0_9NEOP|nr:Cilia- and flagella-associated protein 43 [Frankliniella fusca]